MNTRSNLTEKLANFVLTVKNRIYFNVSSQLIEHQASIHCILLQKIFQNSQTLSEITFQN